MNSFLGRGLHSLAHRSGIMIDVRNEILRHNFDPSNENTISNIGKFIKIVNKMTIGVPLLMVGGTSRDGSYPIAKNINPKKTCVISIGVGQNLIFDIGMAKMGYEVHMYDHTVVPKIKTKYSKKLKYYPIGVCGFTRISNCISLEEIMRKSHFGKKYEQTILKIDCEGMEWEVFLHSPSKILAQICQINVEFHNLDKISNINLANKYLQVLKKLKKNFVITYIAVNNFTPSVTLENGKTWPFTIELHLLNKDQLDNFKNQERTANYPNLLGFEKQNWRQGLKKDVSNWFTSSII